MKYINMITLEKRKFTQDIYDMVLNVIYGLEDIVLMTPKINDYLSIFIYDNNLIISKENWIRDNERIFSGC